MSRTNLWSVCAILIALCGHAQAAFINERDAATKPAAEEKVPSPPQAESKTWSMAISDRYIRTSLSRWAREAGYQLVWQVPKDIEIDVDSTFVGTFEEALLAVLRSLSESEYPVEAVIHTNRVIRIVKLARRG